MDKVLTVVVPVYNVEKYIEKCLDSLVIPDGMMDLLEVIIVNDGTPDKSADIAREYEKQYPKTFRVIDKENGGHGSAWNRGLKEAKGKYLRFLDSDDWLEKENLVAFLQLLLTLNVDVIFSDYDNYHDRLNKVVKKHHFSRFPAGKILDANTFNWMELEYGENSTNFHYCTYKTKILQSFFPLFLEHQFYDDAILFVAPVVVSKTIYYWDNLLYLYRVGVQTQTMNKDIMQKRYPDFDKVIKSQISFVKSNPVESVFKKKRLEWVINAMIKKQWERLSRLPYGLSKQELKEWKNFVDKEWPICSKSKLMRLYDIIPFYLYWNYINKF